ncbi:MAG: single-stranded-DNA-specific exonuclease, partial [Verrucomicrobiota bacterium]
GIVFKLCHALLKTRPVDGFDLKAHLDLVALGTVADIVPLTGENRMFVQHGAREIARTARPGLRKLMEVSAVHPPIFAEDIGFRLGPRLNASGRLSTAEKSLRLLLTKDESEAAELAEFLDKQNRERQEVEKQTFLAADEIIAKTFDPARDAAIVVGARGWHQGVLGIVASRIVRKYRRPAIVIGFDETGLGKGSGRSIEGFNLVKALERCAEHLEKFGGHEMASGLTIREGKIDTFTRAFAQTAREMLSDEDLQPRLRLDHELDLAQLNVDLLHWHEMLQPFGNANPQPLFFAREVEPAAPPRIINEKHLILRIRQRNSHRRAVFFDGAAEQLPSAPWDIAFRIRADDYEGEKLVGIQIQALRQSAPID